MMSFSARIKAELCRGKLDNKADALAELYGVLLFSNTFSPDEIRIITASPDFAQRLPRLLRRAVGLGFDRQPDPSASGKRTFLITDRDKIFRIFAAYDIDSRQVLSLHINYSRIEEDSNRIAFVRGAFLAGGSVTDPAKGYHLELCTTHASVAREAYSILLDLDLAPKQTSRSGSSLLYFKKSEEIEKFLITVGAPAMAMEVMNAKVEKGMRNEIQRKVNCDYANTDKTVAAAQEQLAAIRKVDRMYGLTNLPDNLQQAALLRLTNPEASLADLASLSLTPVSKSGLSHRLKKIIELSRRGTDTPSGNE